MRHRIRIPAFLFLASLPAAAGADTPIASPPGRTSRRPSGSTTAAGPSRCSIAPPTGPSGR
jgi:hypothetical protein